MPSPKSIKLVDLLVNTENYRFEPVASQKEAIDKMVNEQSEKLYNLAIHIIEHGLNPNDPIQVVASNHDHTKFIVLEGNRRVVALKILNQPELVDDKNHLSLYKKFKKLHDSNKTNLYRQIICSLYSDPSEADVWIKLKHAGQSNGIGTVDWNAQQVQRFEEKVEGKSSVALQTLKILKHSSDVPKAIKDNLNNLPITNLDRLLSDPDVRDMLCIDVKNGILQSDTEEKEVIKGLTKLASDLLDPKFNVKKIYTKEDRLDYIKNFPKTKRPSKTKKASKPWQFSEKTTTSTATTTATTTIPKERNILIPKKCKLGISNKKINKIYDELQKLDIRKYTNSAAVLFRVFIELSIDTYIEHFTLTPALSSAKSGTDFQQKVFQVANHMESKKFADPTFCKGIKTSIKDSNDILGIDTWHAYIHNNRFSPKADNLIITWDNMEDFIKILWDNIK